MGVQLADTVATGKTNSHRPRHRFVRPNATTASRSRSRHLHDQPSPPGPSRSEVAITSRLRKTPPAACAKRFTPPPDQGRIGVVAASLAAATDRSDFSSERPLDNVAPSNACHYTEAFERVRGKTSGC